MLKTILSFLCCLSYMQAESFQMSLEEKIGQLLIVHFSGNIANEEAKTFINEVHVGGFIYYNWANTLDSPSQVKNLSAGLQNLAKNTRLGIPLFIATDQEGGVVSRLENGFTSFPGNSVLGQTQDSSLAHACCLAIGQELQEVGININFAPVVDVNINPNNPIIGIRSFGDNPNIVTDLGRQALLGYKQAGIIASLKHFPGHGDVETDSHHDLPIISKPLKTLQEIELFPFAKLAPLADMIMTAHLMVPALDPIHCSTLSKKTLSYLKDTLGFQGVIISDSLMMDGIVNTGLPIEEIVLQAFNAGCDILLLGGKQLHGENIGFELTLPYIKNIHRFLVQAVEQGRITMERVDEAVQKILSLKDRYLQTHAIALPDHKAHQGLAYKIAKAAIKTQINTPFSFFSNKKTALFCPQILQSNLRKTTLSELNKTSSLFSFEGLCPSPNEIQKAEEIAKNADILLIYSYNAWKNPSQNALIESLLSLKKPTVLIVTRDPIDALLFPQAHVILSTYGPTKPSLKAACDTIKGFQ